jgi:CO/xanthine dehydrogenase FAD-binding subunit
VASVEQHAIKIIKAAGKQSPAYLSLPAGAALEAVYQAAECPELVRRTLGRPLSWQHRTGITVEQTILSPNLAPAWIAALLAWGAVVVFQDGGQEQEIALADFLPRTASRQGKLAAVRLPLDVPGRVWGEAHVAPMPAADPVVTVAAVVDLDGEDVREARLALTGVWYEYARLAQAAKSLQGALLSDRQIDQAARSVAQEITPQGDFRGSADYRREMAAVLTRRVLEACKKG